MSETITVDVGFKQEVDNKYIFNSYTYLKKRIQFLDLFIDFYLNEEYINLFHENTTEDLKYKFNLILHYLKYLNKDHFHFLTLINKFRNDYNKEPSIPKEQIQEQNKRYIEIIEKFRNYLNTISWTFVDYKEINFLWSVCYNYTERDDYVKSLINKEEKEDERS